MKGNKKSYVWIVVGVLLAGSFLVNQNFLKNIRRFQAIQKAEAEAARLDTQIQDLETKLSRLEKDPSEYELLVRQSLGYLRPGEKEVRFMHNPAGGR